MAEDEEKFAFSPMGEVQEIIEIKQCVRCREKIYPAEKRKVKGPLRGGRFFCEGCWTCYECGAIIREVDKFCHNPVDKGDLEIYCKFHNTKFAVRTKEPRHETPTPPKSSPKSESEKKSSAAEKANGPGAPGAKTGKQAKGRFGKFGKNAKKSDSAYCECDNKPKCCSIF